MTTDMIGGFFIINIHHKVYDCNEVIKTIQCSKGGEGNCVRMSMTIMMSMLMMMMMNNDYDSK